MSRGHAVGDWGAGNFMISDPSDAGALANDKSGMIALSSTGVTDTRTLAAPTEAGLVLYLVLYVDLGDLAVTCASGLNCGGTPGTAETIMTFKHENELVRLVSIPVKDGTFGWAATAGSNATNDDDGPSFS